MSVSAIDIIGLPPAVGLTNTALIEVQVGPSGPDSSRKATIAEVLALAPAGGGGTPDFILQAFGIK